VTHLLGPPAVALSDATVAALPADISVPGYDRAALVPSVVHLGVGGFHRAHQAVYFDELAERGNREWGIVGVGISNRELSAALRAQDRLFTVVTRGADATSARVVGVLTDHLLLSEEAAAVRDRLSDPRTRLVTLTITGDGYALDDSQTGPPDSLFEVLVDALELRRLAGTAAFTVLSCDNLPDSGATAKRAVLGIARGRSAELTDWISKHVRFPDSMVDRITPSLGAADRDQIQATFAVSDRCPVVTEPFSQWVIEDDFSGVRPPLDEVGVRFVSDVKPYTLLKTRMLNGTHCALGYLGTLAGYVRTDEAMADPAIAAYVGQLMQTEIAPLLPGNLPGMDLRRYQRRLIERFSNPAVGDQLSRLCRRGSTKMPDYLLPSLLQANLTGSPRRLLTAAVGAWLRYAEGIDLDGFLIDIHDARAQELRAVAQAVRNHPERGIGLPELFGPLADDAEFATNVRSIMADLDDVGVSGVLHQLLDTEMV
jgi:mannitol 2-dehydrogenase